MNRIAAFVFLVFCPAIALGVAILMAMCGDAGFVQAVAGGTNIFVNGGVLGFISAPFAVSPFMASPTVR
jgi:hypothetical protein